MSTSRKFDLPAIFHARSRAVTILEALSLILAFGAESACGTAMHGTGSSPCFSQGADASEAVDAAPAQLPPPPGKILKAFKVTEGEPPQFSAQPRPCAPGTYGIEGAAEVKFQTHLSKVGACQALHASVPGFDEGGFFSGEIPESVVLTSEEEFEEVFVSSKDPGSCKSEIDWTTSNLAVLYMVKNGNQTLGVPWVAQDGATVTIGISTKMVCQGVAASSQLVAVAVVIPAGAGVVKAQRCDVLQLQCGQIP